MPTQRQASIDRLIAEREAHRAVHVDELEWRKIRWPGEWGKVAVHPSADDPTAPICGVTRFEPGGGFPTHAHDFAQVWYVLEGECSVGGETYRPGTVVYHPDPHVELKLETETGVTMFFVQFPGARTGGRPVYDERFDLDERRDPADEPTLA